MRILDVSTAARSLSFCSDLHKSRGLRKIGKTPIWLELDGDTPAIWMARSQVDQARRQAGGIGRI
jgi:hypothetical protein